MLDGIGYQLYPKTLGAFSVEYSVIWVVCKCLVKEPIETRNKWIQSKGPISALKLSVICPF